MRRAIASRIVMKESGKWRSGREVERSVRQRPSGRGGKTPNAFGDDEGVAAEGHGYVVVPGSEPAPFEVVETQLALEIFVDALGAPPLLDGPDDALAADVRRQGDEVEL